MGQGSSYYQCVEVWFRARTVKMYHHSPFLNVLLCISLFRQLGRHVLKLPASKGYPVPFIVRHLLFIGARIFAPHFFHAPPGGCYFTLALR